MGRLIAVLAHLPAVRRALLTVLLLAGVGDMITAIILLAYQLAMTSGFQRVVPSLVGTSFFCTAFPLWFLYSKPYAIRLPGSHNEPRVGSARDYVAKFSRSIAFELMALAGTGVWTLISVSNLHAETPGLINHCGGWPICRMLLAVLALSWICFLFTALPFALLLCSTLYFTIRRHSPMPIFLTSFLAVDWERYAGRPVNRAATVKRTKNGKPLALVPARALEGAEPNTTAGSLGSGRPDSQAPVFSGHAAHASYGGDSARSLDWDVQSGFTDSFSRPASGFAAAESAGGSGAGSPRPEHSVFVLMEEEEKAMEAEAAAAETAAAAAGTATDAENSDAGKDVGAAI
ncbi:hypothetical protein JCM8202_003125 [Rhodotorula sphaerocarpa]